MKRWNFKFSVGMNLYRLVGLLVWALPVCYLDYIIEFANIRPGAVPEVR